MRGTYPSQTPGSELFTPLWISLAQLAFAAVLLYVVRNPAPVQALEANLNQTTDQPAAITLHIPISNVAVAATEPNPHNKQPM